MHLQAQHVCGQDSEGLLALHALVPLLASSWSQAQLRVHLGVSFDPPGTEGTDLA
jgi:hypothetical protein